MVTFQNHQYPVLISNSPCILSAHLLSAHRWVRILPAECGATRTPRAGAVFCLQMRVNYHALFTLGPCSIGCRPMFFWLLGVTVGMILCCIWQCLLSLKRCATRFCKFGVCWLHIVFFDVWAARGCVFFHRRSHGQPTLTFGGIAFFFTNECKL